MRTNDQPMVTHEQWSTYLYTSEASDNDILKLGMRQGNLTYQEWHFAPRGIFQLLDAFVEDVPPRRFALVLELWGRDLAEWLRADATRFTAKHIRHCAERCAQGLAHLHGLELLHADIKPRNVLAKLDGATGLLDPSGGHPGDQCCLSNTYLLVA